METINHECYVSLDVAKLLKKVGFNWEVKTYYHYLSPYDEYNLEFDSISTNYNHLDNADFSAPTTEVTQKWLRVVKGIEVNVLCVYIKHIKKYSYTVFTNEYKHEIIDEGFDTYEEALDSGEKKALEMILK